MSSSSIQSKYYWSPEDGVEIKEFVSKYKPSIIDTNDTPWIWVRGGDGEKEDPDRDTKHAVALNEAQAILKRLETRLQHIEEDDSIPVRAKKGSKSKKQAREEAQDAVKDELKEVAINSKWTTGKWMLFPRQTEVDRIWSTIAVSVANGPLKDAGAFLGKVAPSQPTDSDNPNHIICIYLDDVYDSKAAKKVCEVLLSKHGLEPSACKSDLYTLAGIDSHHPTKLRSSLWRPSELLGGVEKVKELLAAGRAASQETKVGADGIIDSDSEDERIVNSAKRQAAPHSLKEDIPNSGLSSSTIEKEQVKGKGTVHTVSDTSKATTTASYKRKKQKPKSAARMYLDNDIFVGQDGDDDD